MSDDRNCIGFDRVRENHPENRCGRQGAIRGGRRASMQREEFPRDGQNHIGWVQATVRKSLAVGGVQNIPCGTRRGACTLHWKQRAESGAGGDKDTGGKQTPL